MQPTPLVFKHASINDLEKIVSTYNSTISSRLVTADLEPITIESKMDWFNEHSPNHRPLWLLYSQNGYLGWMSFSSFYGRPAYNETVEVSIYLEETARGNGIGKLCLQKAFEACRELKIKTLLGFIFDHNKISLSLFKNMGFEQWAHLPNIANMVDQERGLIIMGKRILD